jgi:hypothetical protein
MRLRPQPRCPVSSPLPVHTRLCLLHFVFFLQQLLVPVCRCRYPTLFHRVQPSISTPTQSVAPLRTLGSLSTHITPQCHSHKMQHHYRILMHAAWAHLFAHGMCIGTHHSETSLARPHSNAAELRDSSACSHHRTQGSRTRGNRTREHRAKDPPAVLRPITVCITGNRL